MTPDPNEDPALNLADYRASDSPETPTCGLWAMAVAVVVALAVLCVGVRL